ncbi:MAG: TGS domain-containing protein, partial [Acidimicrobiia bacterium]|nr:TGS domain-containing protein [Acidimicrobiia bacterium]
MALQFTLPDGSAREFPSGTTGLEVAESIGARLAKAAVAVTVDGEQFDVFRPLEAGGAFSVITDSTEDGRHVLRHSAAHVMAQAVLDLFEGATFGIGPPITDGFYYDFDIGRPFTPDDLVAVEARMAEIIAEDQPFTRDDITAAKGREMFNEHPFKLEIIESVDPAEGANEDAVSVYRNNGFVDLCRG